MRIVFMIGVGTANRFERLPKALRILITSSFVERGSGSAKWKTRPATFDAGASARNIRARTAFSSETMLRRLFAQPKGNGMILSHNLTSALRLARAPGP